MSLAQQRDIKELQAVVQRYHERITEIEHRLGKVEARGKPGRPPKQENNANG